MLAHALPLRCQCFEKARALPTHGPVLHKQLIGAEHALFGRGICCS